jgi:hypothetical protein
MRNGGIGTEVARVIDNLKPVRDEYREDFGSGGGGSRHIKAREIQIQMEEERERT